MSGKDLVHSFEGTTTPENAARILWEQGICSWNRTIINLQYGYNDHDTDLICACLSEMEKQSAPIQD